MPKYTKQIIQKCALKKVPGLYINETTDMEKSRRKKQLVKLM